MASPAFRFSKPLFWGHPYHGLVKGAQLDLPNGETIDYRQPNGNATIYLKRPEWPDIERTATQQERDTDNGHQWRSDAILAGDTRQIYGRNLVDMPVDPEGMSIPVIYFDDVDGTPWLITVALHTGQQLQVTLEARFGRVPARSGDTYAQTLISEEIGYDPAAIGTAEGSRPNDIQQSPDGRTVMVQQRSDDGVQRIIQVDITGAGAEMSASWSVHKTRAECVITTAGVETDTRRMVWYRWVQDGFDQTITGGGSCHDEIEQSRTGHYELYEVDPDGDLTNPVNPQTDLTYSVNDGQYLYRSKTVRIMQVYYGNDGTLHEAAFVDDETLTITRSHVLNAGATYDYFHCTCSLSGGDTSGSTTRQGSVDFDLNYTGTQAYSWRYSIEIDGTERAAQEESGTYQYTRSVVSAFDEDDTVVNSATQLCLATPISDLSAGVPDFTYLSAAALTPALIPADYCIVAITETRTFNIAPGQDTSSSSETTETSDPSRAYWLLETPISGHVESPYPYGGPGPDVGGAYEQWGNRLFAVLLTGVDPSAIVTDDTSEPLVGAAPSHATYDPFTGEITTDPDLVCYV